MIPEIIITWLLFAAIVAVAANTRGRSAIGWLLLAIIISPLIAGLFVLALPRLSKQGATGPFRPDAIMAGTPYRIMPGGGVEAMTKGGLVHFQNVDQFRAAAEGRDFSLDDLPIAERFQGDMNGTPYRLNENGTVTARTPVGLRSYNSWAAFRYAVRKSKWDYGLSERRAR